jgi:choline transport protein
LVLHGVQRQVQAFRIVSVSITLPIHCKGHKQEQGTLTEPDDSNGWMSIIGWWLGAASVANFVASMVLEIVGIWHPDFQAKQWQQWLIYVALTWISVAANVFGSAWIPAFNKALFGISVITLSSTMITLFVVSRNNHASAEFIFTDTTSSSGWGEGWAFFYAIGNAVYTFLGSDCAAHLCEEISNPAKNVPRVIMWPLLGGLLTAFPFAVSLLYAINDLQAVFTTTAGLPLIEIYYQGTGSRVAASILLAMFAFCFFGNLVANGTFRLGACPLTSDPWSPLR